MMFASESREFYLLEDENARRSDNVDTATASSGDSKANLSSTGTINCKAEYLISQLNAANIKKLAAVLVLAFIIFHGFLHWQYGSDSCHWLMSKGRLKGDYEWQPYGCMMHKYTNTDTQRCLRYFSFWGYSNRFVFVGDYSVHWLYKYFIDHLKSHSKSLTTRGNVLRSHLPVSTANLTSHMLKGSHQQQQQQQYSSSLSATDELYEDHKLNLKVLYIKSNEMSDALLERLKVFEDDVKEERNVFVFGFTYREFIANGTITDSLLKDYVYNLTRLMVTFDHLTARKSRVYWKLQDHIDEYNRPEMWKNVENRNIDLLNGEARKILRFTDAIIWEAAAMISNSLSDRAIDGYKLCELGLKHYTQLLWNMYCNDYMNYNDGSCCSSAEPYTLLQMVTYGFFGGSILLVVLCKLSMAWFASGVIYLNPLRKNIGRSANSSGCSTSNVQYTLLRRTAATATSTSTTSDQEIRYFSSPAEEIDIANDSTATSQAEICSNMSALNAISILGFIMAYFYLCDRTNFFMKENKYYSEFSFWIPIGYVFALGLFFTEDTRLTRIFNRNQSDELKGWIVLVVLIYYMTGARRVLAIHMHMRLLLSGFLFHKGYTHFLYMWQTGQRSTGFIRFFEVMFRLNFTTVILCFCMNRPYQFYYFIPLLSFWMAVLYILLLLPPQITAQTIDSAQQPLHLLYLVGKFVGCFSIITILYMSEVFFERIFVMRPWKALFVSTDDDIHEWWYQWKLDRYTVLFGMLFSACFHLAQKTYNICDDTTSGNLFTKRTSIVMTLVALMNIVGYVTFSLLCENEQNCEEIHTYIVFIPIISFVLLRNITGILRTHYSTFFAWFGRISLELFICQYHVWLAADRHGVLVLLPDYPTLNVILTTFIFVSVAHEIHRITYVLLPFVVPPNDWKRVIRNFCIFIVILVPIAHSDGMF